MMIDIRAIVNIPVNYDSIYAGGSLMSEFELPAVPAIGTEVYVVGESDRYGWGFDMIVTRVRMVANIDRVTVEGVVEPSSA